MQVVTPPEDLQVVALGHEGLADVINLLRLLRLASTHGEDDVAVDAAFDAIAEVALVPHEACLLSVLQIVAMALVDLAVNGLFDPHNLVNEPISEGNN